MYRLIFKTNKNLFCHKKFPFIPQKGMIMHLNVKDFLDSCTVVENKISIEILFVEYDETTNTFIVHGKVF